MKTTRHRYLANIFILVFCTLLAACTQSGPSPTPTAPLPTPMPTLSAEKIEELEEVFEIVWGTVNEMYFDPTFGGVNWQAMHDEYLPKVLAAPDAWSAYLLINEMCFELGVSHIGLLPPGMADELDPVVSAPGTLGFDIRILEDEVVVIKVDPGSPAENAGLKPGFIILEIDGNKMEEAEDLIVFHMPPYNDRKAHSLVISVVQGLIHGEPGEERTIVYLDGQDIQQEATLTMDARQESSFSSQELPTMYVGYEARYLENGFAYIRLDGFLPPVLAGVLAAIDEMHDAPGMIIDIRGNPGGFYPVRKAIASQFFEQRTVLWRYFTRPGLSLPGFESVAYTDPPGISYTSPVVILVDVMSGSSSEEFSGALSANGRATIIGMRTTGSDLVADVVTLENGSLFLYPIAQTLTADGTVLENRGVIPDIEIQLDRASLLEGRDLQLEAANEFLEGLIAKSQ